ncbi:hypothetical protein C0989_002093 [Termitomyces sp. Mn162]|nr:hypothetical protein C0989_002093 [Termitomyces sp. Mn162]
MSTPKFPGNLTPTEDHIAKMVYQAMQAEFAARMQATAQLQTSLRELQGRFEALANRMAEVECSSYNGRLRPNISPPEKYNRASRQLVDQFIGQVKAAAKFKRFRDECQKILWVQLYLSGLALTWSHIIMTGDKDPVLNPQHFIWKAWLTDFQMTFGLCNLVQDALNHIAMLQQGSRSITDYCTMFFKLKGRLGASDANSKYIKDCFWKGLNAVAMEALVNMDFAMTEEARDILLYREGKLADMAARKKGQ